MWQKVDEPMSKIYIDLQFEKDLESGIFKHFLSTPFLVTHFLSANVIFFVGLYVNLYVGRRRSWKSKVRETKLCSMEALL